MAEPLWTPEALVAAAGARPEGPAPGPVTGVSIDTRSLAPGDLFVALKAERDGHEFVGTAFQRGAAAALVREDWAAGGTAGPLLRVADPLTALEAVGRAARLRTSARIVAITGSVGKTGTKEALRGCLEACGATHASEKSYNNHWGVPLTLARMPAASRYGVFEIGMNHPGEIRPLTRMVRPHVAVVTTVAPVHIGFFGTEEAIADAKAEIFEGLEPGGIAVLNRDNRHFDRLATVARACGAARIVGFGEAAGAEARLLGVEMTEQGSDVTADVAGERVRYRIGAPGRHYVLNSLAVLAAVKLVGADLATAAGTLAQVRAPVGRGQRTRYPVPGGTVVVIDESYNANPASVRAALSAMAQTPRAEAPRRIAVLGDMRELGEASEALHRELREPLLEAGVDLVLACGPHMAGLYRELPEAMRAGYAEASTGLVGPLLAQVAPGDAVMIKGSLGTNMAPVLAALKAHLAQAGKMTTMS